MEGKSFKEVVNCIRPGEIWYSEYKGIEKTYNSEILIFKIDEDNKQRKPFKNSEVTIFEEEKFALKIRRSFPIKVAMYVFEKGKTIESLVSGNIYCKDEGIGKKITFEEVAGEWLIND